MNEDETHKQIVFYLKNQIQPILSPIIQLIIQKRPKNILEFLKQYAQAKTFQSLDDLLSLQQIASEGQKSKKQQKKRTSIQSVKNINLSSLKRNSISAQSYGMHNDFQQHKIKLMTYPKAKQDCQIIKKIFKKSLTFNNFPDTTLDKLAQIVQIKSFQKDQTIQLQNSLLVVRSGKFKYKKQDQKSNKENKAVSIFFQQGQVYQSGTQFQELSLMYNTKNKIILQSLQKHSSLFIMNRQYFKILLLKIKKQQQSQYINILQKLEIMTGIPKSQRTKLLDIIQEKFFQKEQIVFVQNQETINLCIVFKGQFISYNNKGQKLQKFKQGDFFSQSCLGGPIKHIYSVKAVKNNSVLLLISGQKFRRTCGSLEQILKNSMKQYKTLIINSKKSLGQIPSTSTNE